MNKIFKNFIYQSIFQITKILMPIITIPIVSKSLGPEGIGVYNYTNSIVQYFVLFAALGTVMYGNREISIAWSKNKNISSLFWEIFSFKLVTTLFTILIYLFIIFFLPYRNYYYIHIFSLVGVLFDISWFFMGIEDFKKTSLSNLCVQIITFLAILTFINDSSDTWAYILIQSLSIFASQFLMWFFIKPYIKLERISISNFSKHFKGSIELFIPQIAVTFYNNINKTVIGIFLGNVAVAYFVNSNTINLIFITIITTVDLVLLPHMSGLFASNKTKNIVNIMDTTIHLQLFISIPLMFGMLTVFDKLVPWFFGEDFLYIINIIPYFTLLIVVVPLGMSISRQYLIPIGQIKIYNKSVIIGAIINTIGNLILFPIFSLFGFVFSNILAELFVTITRIKSFLSSTEFKFRSNLIIKLVFSSLIMCLLTRFFTSNMEATLITNLIQVAIAVPIYFLLTTFLRCNLFLDFIKGNVHFD